MEQKVTTTPTVSEAGRAAGFKGHTNIAACFFDVAEQFNDHPALGMAGDDAVLTYRQVSEAVRRFAFFLGSSESSQRVGILSENRVEWAVAYLGILAAGALAVPIDPLLKEEELDRLFSDAGLHKLCVSNRLRDVADRAMARGTARPELIPIDSALSLTGKERPLQLEEDPERPASLIFTSGTTGKSKKVILTHGNILSDIDGFRRRVSLPAGSRFLSVLPLHHTLECTCDMIAPLLLGSSVYYIRELNSREILNGLRKHRITHFIAVPLIFEKLYRGICDAVKKASPVQRIGFRLLMGVVKATSAIGGPILGRAAFALFRRKAGLDSVALMISGGAPLPIEVSKAINLIGVSFIEGYGLTETAPVTSLTPAERIKYGSVGPALDNAEVRLDAPDGNGIGELLVRGPMTTPGYEGNPEATAELLRDGWLHTGDLARIDADGYIFIVGRKKNVIVSAAGKNIYPEEIEAALLASPWIIEAMVYGRKGEGGREEVAAMVYPDFDRLETHMGKSREAITDDDIKGVLDPEIKTICARIADFKRIKHITYRRRELEKTSTRKIKRNAPR
jgi:long-chain acyl-CoA synthetase